MSTNEKPRGLLIDAARCTGCRECMKACMSLHGFEGDPKQVNELSATAYTLVVERKDGTNLRQMCRHCQKPSCASVCPVAALRKTELGPVVYDSKRCIGCRYCMVACPFSVPRYEWDKAVPAGPQVRHVRRPAPRGQEARVRRRLPVRGDGRPARARSCWSRRTSASPSRPDDYYDHVYGETELGGTNVLFLTPKPHRGALPAGPRRQRAAAGADRPASSTRSRASRSAGAPP